MVQTWNDIAHHPSESSALRMRNSTHQCQHSWRLLLASSALSLLLCADLFVLWNLCQWEAVLESSLHLVCCERRLEFLSHANISPIGCSCTTRFPMFLNQIYLFLSKTSHNYAFTSWNRRISDTLSVSHLWWHAVRYYYLFRALKPIYIFNSDIHNPFSTYLTLCNFITPRNSQMAIIFFLFTVFLPWCIGTFQMWQLPVTKMSHYCD